MHPRLSQFLTADVIRRAALDCSPDAIAATGLDPEITGIAYDSRKVKPGNIYFALPGIHADGHYYIPQAIERGAAAVIHQEDLAEYDPRVVFIRAADSRYAMSPVSDAYWNSPSRSLAVVGVTGTEGKSTTVFLVYQLLELAGMKAGFVSTVQYRTGAKEEWNPEHQTTPEAPTVHASLAAMRDYGMEYAVVESSSHGLSSRTNRLGDVAFDVGIMTNVTHEHLEFHGTWEKYREDKANLFRALDRFSHEKPDASPDAARPAEVPSFGVVNADDPSSTYFAEACGKPVLTFSVKGADADLSVRSLESDAAGNSYVVALRNGSELRIRDELPGAFNAGNVLAAMLAVAGLLEKPVSELAPLVPRLRPVRGRMTVVSKGQDFEVLVDYAHTPSSFDAVLPGIQKRIGDAGGKVIVLFGSGGERDRQKRPEQGRIAALWSDIIILADEDPRGEDPMELLEEIAAGCPGLKREQDLFLIPDRPTAIRKAFSLARRGDAVLLLGKGHENSIIYSDRTIPYDEIAEAELALAEMGYGERK